jgi:hypothetical protein
MGVLCTRSRNPGDVPVDFENEPEEADEDEEEE